MPLSIREQLQIDNETRETQFYLPGWPIAEADVVLLMRGVVPDWLRDACRSMVDWSLETGPVDYVGMREQQQHAERTPRAVGSGRPSRAKRKTP